MNKSKSAFTIVELLIVIVIIGILAAITVVAYNGITGRAKTSRAASELKSIEQTINLIQIENGSYPCFDHTFNDGTEKVWSAKYMQWPRNPWGGSYHWEHAQQGFNYSVSVQNMGTGTALLLDKSLDDGNLTTGQIKGNDSRLEYGKFDQSFTDHCH